MGEIFLMVIIGAVIGGSIFGMGYWIDYKVKEAEQKQQAKRQAEDKHKFAPRPKIELFGCSACQGPYKPPHFKHTLVIQNLNHGSVPILEMRLEFKLKHVVVETQTQIWLPSEGASPSGEVELNGLEIYGINKDGSNYEYKQNITTGLEGKFTFLVNTVRVNKEQKNLNTILFYVENWSEQKAAFKADIITDESQVLHSPKMVGKYNSVTEVPSLGVEIG